MMAALTRTTRKRALSLAKESSVSTPAAVATITTTAAARTTKTTTTTTIKGIKSTSSSSSAVASAKAATRRAKLQPPAHVQSTPWVSIQVPRSELDLTTTLKCGQSFRWQREHEELPSGEISPPTWSCVLDHRLWFIRETDDGFRFKTVRPSSSSSSTFKDQDFQGYERVDKAFLRDYFQLDVPLTELYDKWSTTDANFKKKAPFFPGVRMLRQDPVENLFCFICSSNNNISRISQMATKMCVEYGSPLVVPPSEDSPQDSARTFYGFPTIEALAQEGVEEMLRQLGFGYRAKYIATTARMIHEMENGEEWLHGLRKLPYEEAHTALLSLQGVGPKVADCVCLMSLDKHEAIPVDTHVWQIAVRDYRFRFEGKVPKAISPAIYKAVGRHFVELFGGYAGWAHSVLFAADLRTIEGRVKEDPDAVDGISLVQVKKEVIEEEVVVKTEETASLVVVKQEEESVVVKHIREIKLEDTVDPLVTLPAGRRSSKRRKGV
ncbi:8-oxoguanine glycosylase ogg1 [Mortierella sp. NVP41]|nr:8-oxoguanine glycosylase ogg1 [Mortierella sp. NVP41]